MSSPSQQAFLDGLHSPEFQQLIDDIMLEGGSGYRPDTCLMGRTVLEHARLPTPPVSPAPAEHPDEPAARGQARGAPRRRGCGTGGHM
ncbi:hypothetical protein PIB30_021469 [Stylosanthes scabra]|uniref:Uncharacterized protein n=1 Tax=Stylosanthes scabra TaxID=79078 RepID=A0ABU6XAG1_9FABA|nr:hypothetical protein [Stylosanthes scabra]